MKENTFLPTRGGRSPAFWRAALRSEQGERVGYARGDIPASLSKPLSDRVRRFPEPGVACFPPHTMFSATA